MKKIALAALMMAVVLPAAAQDTYESARLLGEDLNGTARYVGMGGAMEALGADISTIGTNPAGIGLFRHSTVSGTLGLVSQQDVEKFDRLGKTNMSFDQLGFVYSTRTSGTSYMNFAFNYHKSRNFNQILSAANRLSNVSSNALSYKKAELGHVRNGGYYLGFNDQGELVGWEGEKSDYRAQTFSTLDYLNANSVLLDADYEYLMSLEKPQSYIFDLAADGFAFDRAHRGWINDFDFNISGNENDRFFWGITVGIHHVNYKGYSQYSEGMVTSKGQDAGVISYGDERKIKGYGADITGGVIFRPVETSPFRIGLYVSTPTFYDLKSINFTEIVNGSDYGCYDYGADEEEYKFKLYTPWKFGVSMGHTVGNNLAIGASYEFSDYGATRNRINDGYDGYGNEDSYTDEAVKRNTEESLKGVHTLKVGAEFKPVPELAVRLGYNYVSAAYDKDGYRNMMLDSPGVMYASTSDYTNWKATNRLTAGLGFKAGNMNIDVAYQYSATKGDFYPFQQYDANPVGATEVNNKRHQVLLTLGYTF
ncbi:MAG: hemin receptor [Prevotella sp.]|nr:hemin receptor [Prevotella sp.]